MSVSDPNSSPDKKAAGDTDRQTKPAPKTSGSFMALLSFVLSALALAVAAWTGLQVVAFKDIPDRVNGDAGRIEINSARLGKLVTEVDQQRQALADLSDSLESGLAAVPELSVRVDQAEQQLANVPGISERSRNDWLITEALYYLRIANAQATLTGDAAVAASALQLADDKLREAADPAMTAVRAKLAQDMAALKAIPAIDRTGISFQLQSLAAQADVWPFRSDTPDNYSPEIEVSVSDAAEENAWDRFVATVKAVLESIISIKETEGSRITILDTADQALIVESIKAELQVARLALISSNTKLFQQSLEQVANSVEIYFDTDAAVIVAARDTLAQLRGTELPEALPDISGSLSLMLSVSSERSQSAAQDES